MSSALVSPEMRRVSVPLAGSICSTVDVPKAVTRAAELAPNSAEVQLNAAFVYKRRQNFRLRIEALRRAEALDPDNTRVRSFLVVTYRCVRDWRNAIQARDRLTIRASGANFFASRWSRARDEFRLSGNIDALKKAIAEEATAGEASAARLDFERFQTAMFERDYANAAHYLSQIAPESYAQAEFFEIASHTKAFYEALLAMASGSAPSLQEHALQTAEREILSSKTATSEPDRSKSLADLALIHALLGRKEEAIREAENAIEVMEGPPGSIEKNAMSSALALVYARTGETEKAVALIEHLLSSPCELQVGAVYNMTLTDLKWRWLWDPLRGHPRFQKLLAGPEPATTY